MHKQYGAGITINTLPRTVENGFVKTVINELVMAIMETILEANDNSGNQIVYELPCSFSMIPNLSKADAQLIVWSEVILVFKTPVAEGGKGFTNTRLIYDKGVPRLEIKWSNGMTNEERTRRRQIIDACTTKKKPELPTRAARR